MLVHALELRRLLSATLSGGGLAVTGTESNDVIVVAVVAGRLVARVNGAAERFTRSSVARVVVVGAGGDDDIDVSDTALPALVRGGGGHDVIRGSASADRLLGDAGNDQLYGNGGDDRLDGGRGADLVAGGDGRDAGDYSTREAAVHVTVARGGYDDGEAGERDNLRGDVEGVVGGAGDDSITGWRGNDVLTGGAGDDEISGDGGEDTLNGDAGRDTIDGQDGDDRLSGGSGNDTLVAGDGRNLLYGNAGNDLLDTRNGETNDAMDGGTGRDIGRFDLRLCCSLSDFNGDHTRDVEDEQPVLV